MANSDWLDLEHLVAKIQRSLAPDASVEHNAKVFGVDTEVERQIDVLVKQRIGQYEMMIAIDCKDYKTPVDVKGVEEFAGMISDIRANKGVLVCPAGFSATAKKLAKKKQIELYRPVDTDDHKWRVKPTMPAIFDYVKAGLSFGISCSYPGPFRISMDIGSIEAYSVDGQALGTPYEVAIARWNNGEYPATVGLHEPIPIFPGFHEVQVDNGSGGMAPVTLTVSLHVTVERFFGQLALDRISGFLDVQTGMTVTNSFTVGAIDPKEIYNTWTRLGEGETPPINPVLAVRGLEGWESRKP